MYIRISYAGTKLITRADADMIAHVSLGDIRLAAAKALKGDFDYAHLGGSGNRLGIRHSRRDQQQEQCEEFQNVSFHAAHLHRLFGRQAQTACRL